MEFDFNYSDKINEKEKKFFYKFFNDTIILEKIKMYDNNRKFNIKIIFGVFIVSLLVFLHAFIKTKILMVGLLLSILYFFIFFIFSKFFFKEELKSDFLNPLLKKLFGKDFFYSKSEKYFKEDIDRIYSETKLFNEYSDIDSLEDSMSYLYKINENIVTINGVEVKTSIRMSNMNGGGGYSKTTNHCYLLKFIFPTLLTKNEIKITNKIKIYEKIFKIILIYFIGSLLSITLFSLILFIIFGILDFKVQFEPYEWFQVFVMLGLPGGFAGTRAHVKNLFFNKKKQKFENNEFNKMYDVYSSEGKENVKKILNTKVINNLVKFTDITKKKYAIFIKGNEMYVKYNISGGYFNFSRFRSLYDSKNYISLYLNIKLIIEFSKQILDSYYSENLFSKKLK